VMALHKNLAVRRCYYAGGGKRTRAEAEQLQRATGLRILKQDAIRLG
jgi:hypothetical protein